MTDVWDTAAKTWIAHVRSGGDARWEAQASELEALLPPPNGLVVDAGCGEGRWARELAGLGYTVVGCDASGELIAAARAEDPDGTYHVADVRALPFKAGEAAVITCVNVLQHLPDLDSTLREFSRALSPEGTLIVSVVHPVAETGAFDPEREAVTISDYFGTGPRVFPLGKASVTHYPRTIDAYSRALSVAGLTLDAVREVPGRTRAVPLYAIFRAVKPATPPSR